MAGSFQVIPHFIFASSPEGLMREMLALNVKKGRQHDYFAIQKDGNRWVAWYNAEVKIKLKANKKALEVVVESDS